MITPLSPDWLATKAWLDAEIAAAQRDLECPTVEPRTADQIRGRIAAFRHFLAEAQKPPVEAPAAAAGDKSGY